MSTDTDSNYCAFSGALETRIRPCRRKQFFDQYDEWFVAPYCVDHKPEFADCWENGQAWTMRPCCEAAKKFNNRTPGLFKEEFVGSGMVALNSKTYLCWKDDDDLVREHGPVVAGVTDGRDKDRVKYSSKGVSKKTNSLTREQFMHVLKTGQAVRGVNTGFLRKDGKTFSYTQEKLALTYFYGKRMVDDNGVDTRPLNL